MKESKDFVFGSSSSFKETFCSSFQKSQELLPVIKSQYLIYEDVVLKAVKDGLATARDNPTMTTGIALTSGILIMRGPRRFLFRKTFGRFQSEEAILVKAEKSLTELDQSVQLTKNETKKLIERAGYAQNALLGAQSRLRGCAKQIQGLSNDLYKSESKVADFMDDLRQLSGRDALKLRVEVASMLADMKEQRKYLDKRITRISELGISV